MSEFKRIKTQLIELCNNFELPVPEISRALDSDVTDFTSTKLIRIKESNCSESYQICNVFGHWLCSLHNENEDMKDKVADIIVRLMWRIR